MNKLMTIGIISVLALLLAACQVTVRQPGEPEQNTISVNGNAQFKVAPDEATVFIAVETNGTTSKEAQDKNTELMNTVQAALKRAGVEESEMQTTNYNIYPNVYWDNKEQRQVEAGFKASHTLQVKTRNLDKVGELTQVAIDAGATRIDSVSFALSKTAENDAKDEALRQATQDARQKADALADGLGLSIKRVVTASINEYNVMPFYRGGVAYAEAAMMDKGMPQPPSISPQDVDVMANVQVVFEIA